MAVYFPLEILRTYHEVGPEINFDNTCNQISMGERTRILTWHKQVLEMAQLPRDIWFRAAQLFDKFLAEDWVKRQEQLIISRSRNQYVSQENMHMKNMHMQNMGSNSSCSSSSPGPSPTASLNTNSMSNYYGHHGSGGHGNCPQPNQGSNPGSYSANGQQCGYNNMMKNMPYPYFGAEQSNMECSSLSSLSTACSPNEVMAPNSFGETNSMDGFGKQMVPARYSSQDLTLLLLAVTSLVVKLELRKYYAKYFDKILAHSGMLQEKNEILMREWKIVETVNWKVVGGCLMDYLDYFDHYFKIKAKKAYALDLVLYFPLLLYARKSMLVVASGLWFLSHKRQPIMHDVYRELQNIVHGVLSPDGTADVMNDDPLREVVYRLRDQFAGGR